MTSGKGLPSAAKNRRPTRQGIATVELRFELIMSWFFACHKLHVDLSGAAISRTRSSVGDPLTALHQVPGVRNCVRFTQHISQRGYKLFLQFLSEFACSTSQLLLRCIDRASAGRTLMDAPGQVRSPRGSIY
jgi:hypothetical protein